MQKKEGEKCLSKWVVFVIAEKRGPESGECLEDSKYRITHDEGGSGCLILVEIEAGKGNLACALVRDLLVPESARRSNYLERATLSDSWAAGSLSSPGSNQSRYEECARSCRLGKSDRGAGVLRDVRRDRWLRVCYTGRGHDL